MSTGWFLFLFDFAPLLILIALGYGFGRWAESRHYRSILAREADYQDLIVVAARKVPDLGRVPETAFVDGSVCVSIDYFKRVVAYLRMIFGGRVNTYESLLDRGRREAILRMQEKARELGATMIFNVRLETSSISKSPNRGAGAVEVLAYGTAVIARD